MVEALVEFDCAAHEPDELTLKKGDIITGVAKEPGNGWWEVSLKGQRGLFPDNFVKGTAARRSGCRVLQHLPPSLPRFGTIQQKSPDLEALVEFEYAAGEPDELTLKKGDIITGVVKEPGEGWWEGSLKGQRGLFPDNFVKVLTKDGAGDKDDKNGVVLRTETANGHVHPSPYFQDPPSDRMMLP